MLDYKHLFFAVNLDIANVLTTIGVEVAINDTVIEWAHDFGDLGGEPEGLDCTPLASKVHLEKAGMEEQEAWTIDYYYNDSDYSYLEGIKGATTSSKVTVTFDNGTVFSNTGVVQANYLSGQSVNTVADAHAVIELSGEWTKSTTSKTSVSPTSAKASKESE